MTLENVSIALYITNKLRDNITDPNSTNRVAQFGNWIYPDRPKIMKLLNDKNNFPRISVETVTSNTESEMGMACTEHVENINLRITVWSVRDLLCVATDTSDEDHTYLSGTTIYELENLPLSAISMLTGRISSLPHTFVHNTDYRLIDNDADGLYDSVEWLGVDTPDNGTDFSVSYQRKMSADELSRFIAREIHGYLRDNWRLWPERILWSYRKTGGNPIDFDSDLGVHKYELTVSFQGINLEDSI